MTVYPDFEDAYPQDILRWAAETYNEKLAIVTSFQPTGIVTLHMMSQIAPNTTVLTLDTGLLFPETYALVDELEARFKLNLVRVKPEQTVQQQAEEYGPALWERTPDLCCQLRKITPLGEALTGYDAWITGLRRDQSAGRATTPVVGWDKKYEKTKVSPFATWTDEMIWLYIEVHHLPYNALHDQGYPSIGCWPCTRQVQVGEDVRAGRWANHAKAECGIHVQANGNGNGAHVEQTHELKREQTSL